MEPVIEIINVSKYFDLNGEKLYANSNINISIGKNELIGLFGANGSGKTTLVRQVTGIMKPSSGYIMINGRDVMKDTKNIKREIGYMSQSAYAALWGLKVKEAIKLSGRLHDLPDAVVEKRYAFYKEYFSLRDGIDEMAFGSLSGGLKKMVVFIISTLKDKPIYIFDEPSNELDPKKRKLLWDRILNFKNNGSTIILVTHNIKEVEGLVDRVIILSKGEVTVDSSLKELTKPFENKLKLKIAFENSDYFNRYDNALKSYDFVEILEKKDLTISLNVHQDYLDKLTDELNCFYPTTYSVDRINLEDICFSYF